MFILDFVYAPPSYHFKKSLSQRQFSRLRLHCLPLYIHYLASKYEYEFPTKDILAFG